MMGKISQINGCPTFVPAPLIGPVCVVFEETVVQVAQASLPATAIAFTAIGGTIRSLIAAQLPEGAAPGADTLNGVVREVLAGLISAGSLTVDACIPAAAEPTLAAHLLPDEIIHCGSVDAIVTARTTTAFTTDVTVPVTPAVPVRPAIPIRLTVPAGTIGSSMVMLSIHGAQAAPGVFPTDNILERLLKAEGATTCLVGGTTVSPTGGLITTTLVSVRAAYIVSMQVVRVLNPSLPSLAEAVMDLPEVSPSAAAKGRRQRTIVWSMSVDDTHTG